MLFNKEDLDELVQLAEACRRIDAEVLDAIVAVVRAAEDARKPTRAAIAPTHNEDTARSVASERQQRVAGVRQYTGRPAKYRSTCPVCARYIVVGKSKVLPLDEPLLPPPDSVYAHPRGFVSMRSGKPVALRPLSWAHAHCVAKLDRRGVDLRALAAARRTQLQAMRAEARDNDFPPRRQ